MIETLYPMLYCKRCGQVRLHIVVGRGADPGKRQCDCSTCRTPQYVSIIELRAPQQQRQRGDFPAPRLPNPPPPPPRAEPRPPTIVVEELTAAQALVLIADACFVQLPAAPSTILRAVAEKCRQYDVLLLNAKKLAQLLEESRATAAEAQLRLRQLEQTQPEAR